VSGKVWFAGALALLAAAGLCFVNPRLGGFALILLALGAVALFAHRFL
jgi:hypothetical protein